MRGAELEIRHVFLAGSTAMATTSDIDVGPPEGDKAPLLIRLVRHGECWLVDWIDMRVAEPFTRRMNFLLVMDAALGGMS